jgi:hypothetical protein
MQNNKHLIGQHEQHKILLKLGRGRSVGFTVAIIVWLTVAEYLFQMTMEML